MWLKLSDNGKKSKAFLTKNFLKRAKKIMSHDELEIVVASIEAAPHYWPVIPGTKGARKARIPLRGKGKSGGGRVIYFWRSHSGAIYFITVYTKNEKEDLYESDKENIRKIIEGIEADEKSKD